jgi:acyl-CoA synthetase (NDP forming)
VTTPASGPVVLVGASAKTPWAYWLLRNLRLYDYPGEIWPVSRSADSFGGLPVYPDLASLPGSPSMAVVMQPAKAAVDTVDELLALGARTVVVVANGFKETGTAEGAELEKRLVSACDRAGARLIGPNCVGFASYHERICAVAEPVPPDTSVGSVTVVSQSGALLSGVLASLQHVGLGIDEACSLGNGGQFGLAEAVLRAVERPTTSMICAVVEGVGDPEALAAALDAARDVGKPVVVLRLGSSDQAKGLAASHTGAVVGETRLLDEWFAARGAVVTDEIEEFSQTALLSTRLADREGGVFVVTGSGGAAGMAADFAARFDMPLADLAAVTAETIGEHLSPGALVSNPLDMVGGAPAAREAIYTAIARDPGVSVIIEPVAVMWPDDSEGRVWHRENAELLARIGAEHGVLVIFASTFHQEPPDFVRRLADAHGVVVSGSLELTTRALGRLLPARPAPRRSSVSGAVALGEAASRPLLAALDLPLAVGEELDGVDAVVAAAGRLRPPWVLKTAASGVAHKGAVGGVRVGLRTVDELRAAAEEMASSVGAVQPADQANRFLLQEMAHGPELLVTLVRDPIAGPVLVVGIGGWAAELREPLFTCALPASADELANAVRRSGVNRAVAGAAALDALVDVLQRLAEAFLPGGSLSGAGFVECNPVVLAGDGPRLVDVLVGGTNGDGRDGA